MESTDRPLKFAVVGSGCAGKTTVSRIISQQLNINFVEIDAVLWLPGWVERSKDELRRIINEETVRDSWVIDGNYRYLYDLTVFRADVIIWLNFSFISVFRRTISRTVRRTITHEEMFPGCSETFYKSFFTKHSIPWRVMKKWKKKRIQYRKIFDEKTFGDKEYIECHNQKELDQYVSTLGINKSLEYTLQREEQPEG